MRLSDLLPPLLLLNAGTVTSAQAFVPFHPPLEHVQELHILFKRQACPAAYPNSCGNLQNGQSVCCRSGTTCTYDQAGNVACCPDNYSCTGVISGTLGSTASTSNVVSPTTAGASDTGVVVGTTTQYVTSTTSLQTPSPTLTGAVATDGATLSTIAYSFFTFVYIPSPYPNAAVCSSAWSTCQIESAQCLQTLAGVNGVTVSGNYGGGTSRAGSSQLPLSQANVICSSLSVSACGTLQLGNCDSLATGAGQPNAALPKRCGGMAYAVGAGAVVGAVNAMI